MDAAPTDRVARVAARIADAAEIRRSRQFPYQYLAAYLNVSLRTFERHVARMVVRVRVGDTSGSLYSS